MKIEWNLDKDIINLKKHNISFKEASEIFHDTLHISVLDERIDYSEERWITIGQTKKTLLVVVAHTYMESNGYETIRIISARKATKKERVQYENCEI